MNGAVAPGGDPGKEGRAASGIPVVPAFDGYRAWAIMAIVALHMLVFSGLLQAVGHNWFFRLTQATLGQAIDVLFVISGFVVFLPTVARRGEFGNVGSYALRRAARLVPAYYLILALIFLLLAVAPTSPAAPLPGVGNVAAHLAFIQTPLQMVHPVPTGFGVNGVVWTLSLEAIFYVLLPLVAGWYYRHPLAGLGVAAAATALWHEVFLHLGSVNSHLGLDISAAEAFRLQVSAVTQFPFFAFSFAAGMTGAWALVAARERWEPERLTRLAAPVQLGCLGLFLLFVYLIAAAADAGLISPEAARGNPVLALGYSGSLAALMVATALGPARWQWPFAHPLVRRLGDISYGVYLVHVVIVFYALRELGLAAGKAPPVLVSNGLIGAGDGTVTALVELTIVVVPLSLLYGYLSAHYVEQPIRRWARRYGRRGQPVPAG